MSTIQRGTMPQTVRAGRASTYPPDDAIRSMSIGRPGEPADYFTVDATGRDGRGRTARAAASSTWARAQRLGVAFRCVGFDADGKPVGPDVPAHEIRVYRVA